MKLPENSLKTARLIIKGKDFTMKDELATYRGHFSIDPNKKPKTIDM